MLGSFLLNGLLFFALPVVCIFNNTFTLNLNKINSTINQVCFQMIVHNNYLYHISSEAVFQDWQLSNLSKVPNTMYFNTTQPLDFFVQSSEDHLYILIRAINPNGTFYNYSLAKGVPTLVTSYSIQNTPSHFIKTVYGFYGVYRYQNYSDALLAPGNRIYVLASLNGSIVVSPNGLYIVVWDLYGHVFIYNASDISLLWQFTPQNPLIISGVTNTITVNSASDLMVIESDGFNPVMVINLIDYGIFASFNVSVEIKLVTFFEGNDDYLLVVGTNTSFVYVIENGSFYEQSNIFLNGNFIYGTKYNGKVYFCYNSQIKQYTFQNFYITVVGNITNNQSTSNSNTINLGNTVGNLINTLLPPGSTTISTNTTSSTNTTNPNNTTNTTSSTNATNPNNATNATNATNSTTIPFANESTQINPSDFYLSLNLSQNQQAFSDGIGNSISFTSIATSKLTAFTMYTPITTYCLGFLNYFSLSSIYVLLNVRIPEDIFRYLSATYKELNVDVLGMIGLDVQVPAISDEKVYERRAIYFAVSSDIISNSFSPILIAMVNYIVILVWRVLCGFFSEKSIFRKLYQKCKMDFIYGKIIGLLFQTTLPWSFLFLDYGVQKFGSKINFFVNLFAFFFTFCFPVLYLYHLIRNQKTKLLLLFSYRQRNQKQKGKRQSGKNQIKNLQQQKKIQTPNYLRKNNSNLGLKNIPFKNLLSKDVMEQFFLCGSNCLYPLLVLLKNPLFFLVGILLYNLFIVVTTAKRFRISKNSFIVSLYPFVFHICFFIFQFCESKEILIYSQFVCLISLLLGSIHISLDMLIKGALILYKFIKNRCFYRQIKPINQRLSIMVKEKIIIKEVVQNLCKEKTSIQEIKGKAVKKVKKAKNEERPRRMAIRLVYS